MAEAAKRQATYEDLLAVPREQVGQIIDGELVVQPRPTVDRVRKMAIYARERVPFAWLVDPLARTLEVFRSEGEAWMRIHASEGDAVVRADPFSAIELELAVLWER